MKESKSLKVNGKLYLEFWNNFTWKKTGYKSRELAKNLSNALIVYKLNSVDTFFALQIFSFFFIIIFLFSLIVFFSSVFFFYFLIRQIFLFFFLFDFYVFPVSLRICLPILSVFIFFFLVCLKLWMLQYEMFVFFLINWI